MFRFPVKCSLPWRRMSNFTTSDAEIWQLPDFVTIYPRSFRGVMSWPCVCFQFGLALSRISSSSLDKSYIFNSSLSIVHSIVQWSTSCWLNRVSKVSKGTSNFKLHSGNSRIVTTSSRDGGCIRRAFYLGLRWSWKLELRLLDSWTVIGILVLILTWLKHFDDDSDDDDDII